MATRDADGKMIKVGDQVGFKCDVELSGQIISIEAGKCTLFNRDGFAGNYLRYATTTVEDANRVWKE
jgi:hypothetical protein